MEIQIVTGFLGAGKTTFLNKYLPRLSGKTVVIENEFGEIGIDGDRIQEDIPVREKMCIRDRDLALGNTMDVAANLFLGNERTRGGFLQKKVMNEEAKRLLELSLIHIFRI